MEENWKLKHFIYTNWKIFLTFIIIVILCFFICDTSTTYDITTKNIQGTYIFEQNNTTKMLNCVDNICSIYSWNNETREWEFER